MRQRSFIALVVVPAVLLGGAVAVYAYDSSRADTIASGVAVGDVELEGLTAAEARSVLEERVARPLRRPVKVRFGGRTFRLTPRQARLRTDVDATVRDALARSRDGNLLTRTFRDVAGVGVAADLDPHVSYSPRAVNRLVRRVKATFDRPVQEPSVSPSPAGLSVVRGRTGLRISAARLRGQIVSELELPGARIVRPQARIVRPRRSRAELRRRYRHYITIDRSGYTLRYYRNLKRVRSYTIAVGQAGLETPAGLYDIQNKAVDPAWHVPKRRWAGRLAGKVIPGGRADNPLKARWLGIVDGAGIHGTDDVGSLGTNASHGCIRMSIPEVKDLYDRVPVGIPVYIG
jgi:lipoprotein-anchoring transpeptidase ErfK/SrfK